MILEDFDRELVLHRLSEPVEDDELRHALDRLRKNFYEAWKVLKEYREDNSRLEDWQRAEKPSLAWRKALFLEEWVSVLAVALYG